MQYEGNDKLTISLNLRVKRVRPATLLPGPPLDSVTSILPWVSSLLASPAPLEAQDPWAHEPSLKINLSLWFTHTTQHFSYTGKGSFLIVEFTFDPLVLTSGSSSAVFLHSCVWTRSRSPCTYCLWCEDGHFHQELSSSRTARRGG